MQKVTNHSTQRTVKVKKTQDHLNVCAADGTTTTLTFHFVAVSGWGGDGRDDGVCAGVSIISRIFAVRVCGCVHAAVNCLDLCSVDLFFTL